VGRSSISACSSKQAFALGVRVSKKGMARLVQTCRKHRVQDQARDEKKSYPSDEEFVHYLADLL